MRTKRYEEGNITSVDISLLNTEVKEELITNATMEIFNVPVNKKSSITWPGVWSPHYCPWIDMYNAGSYQSRSQGYSLERIIESYLEL